MRRGQGALEYLLLIGGAVVVAAAVIVLLLNTSSSGGSSAMTSVDTYLEAQAASGAEVGLLKNTSFEKVTLDWIANGGGPREIISSGCTNGAKCIYISVGAGTWSGYRQAITVGSSGPLVEGKTYVFSGYKKLRCTLTFVCTPALCNSGVESPVTVPANWTRISKAFTVPVGTTSITFYATTDGSPAEGYCDMILLRAA